MESIELGGVEFVLDQRPPSQRGTSDGDRFVLVKTSRLLSFYEFLVARGISNILEIGIAQGGSLIYFDKLFAPKSLVGIDVSRTRVPALDKYIEGRSYIKVFYGCSQDRPQCRNIAQASFPEGIDLVVDDASHAYERTKTTFENIFPLVKAGGMYVIEDWGWSHKPNHQGAGATWSEQPALTNLILNLVVLTAVTRVIESITITDSLACITKGRGMLPASGLELSKYLRGKEMALI